MNFMVLIDTQEQKPWIFDKRTRGCLGSERIKLKTADYTVKGYEDLVLVERKGTIQEYAQNVFQERFYRELERLRAVRFAYIVLEFPFWYLVDYPRVPGIPSSIRRRIQVSGSHLLKAHLELERDFPSIRWHFVGSKGKEFTASLFKRVLESEQASGRESPS